MDEKVEWKNSPSQWVNFGTFLLCALVFAAVAFGAIKWEMNWLWIVALLPLGWAGWAFLTVKCQVYELTSQRLRCREGVLNQSIDELELYRVKDVAMERPFVYRMVGLSTLLLETSDRSHPELKLAAIPDAEELREKLRKQVEYWRDRKRVREVDFADDDQGDSVDLL